MRLTIPAIVLSTLVVISLCLGQTWIAQNSGTTNNLYGVTFTDSRHGWAVGEPGTIVYTANGGRNWTTQLSGMPVLLLDVAFLDTSNGWVVGFDISFDGLILRTTNGGSMWNVQDIGTTNRRLAVTFIDSSNGWIVGDNGTIIHTTDGGETWSPQESGTASWLYDIAFVDDRHGWVSGSGGAIMRTTNRGETWTPQSSGTTNGLWGVVFVDTSLGWVVGDWGTIVHTTNGGQTWAPQTSGTTNPLWDVVFTNVTNGWAVGLEGTILRTTNGGNAWAVEPSGTMMNLSDIVFPDSHNGWIVGDEGTVLHYFRAMAPDSVTGVVATCNICDSVCVSWNDVSGDSIYHIFRNAVEVGTAPQDSRLYWDQPTPGTHTYRISAENRYGTSPLSAPATGRIQRLLLADSVPDTIYSGDSVHFSFIHCNGVDSDSIFLSFSGTAVVFLCTFAPVLDRCSVSIPDTIETDHPDSHFRVLSFRDSRIDTLCTNDFLLTCRPSDPITQISYLPQTVCLAQSYPNPFNASTTLIYSVNTTEHVSLRVYDLLSRPVATLKDGLSQAGIHHIVFNARDLPSGIYFARLQAGGVTATQKLVLLK